MNEVELADLHDELTNGKARRGKLGGIGAGQKHSTLLDGPKRHATTEEVSRMPDRPLYKRFILSAKKQLCQHTVVSVLEAHGGRMRWHALVQAVARECDELVTRDFTYRVLVNVPKACLSDCSAAVKLLK